MRRSRFSLYRLAWIIGGVALAIVLTLGGIVVVMRAKMETTRRVVSEALQLADSHDYANALPRAEQALTLVTETVGATSEDAAFVHAILAGIYEGTGAFDKAERSFEARLKAFEGTLGPDHDMVAHTLSRFGDYYDRRGLYDKGEPLKRRALAGC